MTAIITKTALIPDLKVGVFYRAVFGIENFDMNVGVLDPWKFLSKFPIIFLLLVGLILMELMLSLI